MEPDVRDAVVDYVRYWSERTGLGKGGLVGWIGLGPSTYYSWGRRYGRVNEHNAWVPRDFWLEAWEKAAIVAYYGKHPLEGYRRLTYMMLDADVVAVSPSSVYRVLREAGLLRRWNGKPSTKGTGFTQPDAPHRHWHTDISYVNIGGTFYYLCSVLDGYSRYIVHWEIRERMTERDVAIVVQRAREAFPDARPQVISDNGPQFIAREFKELIRLMGMSHVRTSPHYPQSNGKCERWQQTVKRECLRPGCPLSLADARRLVARFVEYYNTRRLHSALGYIAPKDKLEGRAEAIFAAREQKLQQARQRRQARRLGKEGSPDTLLLTGNPTSGTLTSVGETEAGSAGAQPARDNRPGIDERSRRGRSLASIPFPKTDRSEIPLMPPKTHPPHTGENSLSPGGHLSISG